MLESETDDERGLIEGYLRGDPAALRYVDGWIDVVLKESFRALQNDWDDVRQEVRIRVFRNLSRERFDGRSSLHTYVHRIARNVSIDFSRRAHRRRESGELEDLRAVAPGDPPGGAPTWMDRDVLLKVLEGMPEGDRVLLWLVCGLHYSYIEVAKHLKISEGAVKVRVHRCKDRLVKRCRALMP